MSKRILLAWSAALVLLLSACGSGAEDTTITEAPDQPTATTAAEQDAPATTTGPPATTTTVGDEPAASGSGIPAELAAALTSTTEVNSGRMEGSFEIVGAEGMPAGTSVSLPFSGAFDNDNGIFLFSMDMTAMATQLGGEIPPEMADLFGEMQVLQVGDTTYMNWPFFSFLGVQTPWISTPTEESDTLPSAGFGGATPGNPADFLSFFEETNATIEEIGRETLRGVETTHYLAVFDTETLLENATPEERAELEAQGPLPLQEMPMDIWIGDDGLVYKYVIDISGDSVEAAPGEGFERMVMTFEMYDWGASIDVEIPPADQVTDASELEALFGP